MKIEKSNEEYKQWLVELKTRIRQSQIKAAVRVNEELIRLYWGMGQDIVARQMEAAWGSGFFEHLSKDLRSEFPYMQGFSERNLYRIKKFYLFYSQEVKILPQVVAKLGNGIPSQLATELQKDLIPPQVGAEFETHPIFQIPWGHHDEILTRCKSIPEALFYVQKTIENGWSRAVLVHFMEADLYTKQGKALTNFSRHLPEVQSDLANQVLKDPYNFDFLTLTEDYKERELEDALTTNITKFLTELGQGFAYVGRQVQVKIGNKDKFIDLLFYHTELRCYVVVELKTTEFDPGYTGTLGVYISAINHQRKKDTDNPTIGLIICQTKDSVVAEYALQNINQPIGVSEYELSNLLPADYKSALPTIEEIEEGLKS